MEDKVNELQELGWEIIKFNKRYKTVELISVSGKLAVQIDIFGRPQFINRVR